jgi:hypothetical protein
MSETIDRRSAADDLLGENDAARIIGMSVPWLQADRVHRNAANRKGPPFYKLGKSVRYKHSDCVTWREQRRVSVASDLAIAKEPA